MQDRLQRVHVGLRPGGREEVERDVARAVGHALRGEARVRSEHGGEQRVAAGAHVDDFARATDLASSPASVSTKPGFTAAWIACVVQQPAIRSIARVRVSARMAAVL